MTTGHDAALLAELAQSGAKASVGENLEAELMRLADDPLLVHRYLERQAGELEDRLRAIPPAALPFLLRPENARADTLDSIRSYHDTGLIFEASREPVPFFATGDDAKQAITGFAHSSPSPAGPVTLPDNCVCAVVIRGFLLLSGLGLAVALAMDFVHFG
jgi:hypothetical protein